ncbi:MBL fold metallo-hydrolase [Maridesulfovibrio zosterae]|uniref:MBL fold metallo-hydrolase n=1 Tax=Maridesulfovibrio zosterae TaxID=82171 RepID=UPI000426E018|nr:MBL fold metallo-hydrolase [Maridesulfovibrio zosterae]
MPDSITDIGRRNALKKFLCMAAFPLLITNAEANDNDKRTMSPMPAGVKNLPKQLFDNTPLIPTKVADNLYCIGSMSVVSWVLNTSDGIILIDSMWDNRDAQLIIDGLRKVDLNPEDIKMVMLTHGHGDHYGGAQYIKDKYNAKILMSERDFHFMNENNKGANGPRSPKCKVDAYIHDGQKVKLGDTTITVIETPGHTPGCLSFIYPARENGKTFMVGQWGGSGLPRTLEAKQAYRKSIDHFAEYTRANHVNVMVTAHLFSENGYKKLDACRSRKTAGANPFFVGEEGYSDYQNRLRVWVDKAISDQKKNS